MKEFSVHLPDYEGPLDLLLTIVRRAELSLSDLPLAPIASQYLAYIQQAEAMDVNLSMEWVEMTARLIQWKSQSLLPSDPTLPDPAVQLAQELRVELETLSESERKQATQFLLDRCEEMGQVWRPLPDVSASQSSNEEYDYASLWTVRQKSQTLRDIFRRRRQAEATAYEVSEDVLSIEEIKQMALAELQLVPVGEWFSARPWFAKYGTAVQQISLFLVLLEMARAGLVQIQDDVGLDSVQLLREFDPPNAHCVLSVDCNRSGGSQPG